jgi:hypothetical protein
LLLFTCIIIDPQGADIHRIGQYVLKWLQWTRSGIHELHNINILAAPKIIK